ncbi:MAG: TrkA family potassium uptake protein [Lachnospiraceae bacterium]|nr:TrkA family potassium uptake protein [Lachnospiraceae bacterium]
MDSALIVGAGRFGMHIARRMSELGCEVMVVDKNEDRINAILPFVTDARIGECTNADFLRTLDIAEFSVCIVTIGDDFQSSLETTSILKDLGARVVVSRAVNDIQVKFLLRNGADEVVYPEKEMAMRVATKYASNGILDFIQFDGNHSIYELALPSEWSGRTLSQLDIRKKYNINIIAVKHEGRVVVPKPDMAFDTSDTLFALGELAEIKKCFKI